VELTLVSVLEMREFSLRWVPHDLIEFQKAQCVKDSRRLVKPLKVDAKNDFVNIITGGDGWYCWSHEHKSQWSISGASVPTQTLRKIDTKRQCSHLFSVDTTYSRLMNCQKDKRWIANTFVMLFSKRREKRWHLFPRKVELKGGISIWTIVKLTILEGQRHSFKIFGSPDCHIVHTPYSPDISPCDFWFFGWSKEQRAKSKEQMRGHEFHGTDEVRSFLLNLWENLDQNSIISVYREWIERFQQVIRTNGEYYFKQATRKIFYEPNRASVGGGEVNTSEPPYRSVLYFLCPYDRCEIFDGGPLFRTWALFDALL
jgi:histone-lysine N-methyltransferase SETMAR